MLGVWKLPTLRAKLQALVYDILPLTTTVFSYSIGSRKLSAKEHCFLFLFCFWCSNSSKFVTNNSNYTRRFVLCCHVAYASSSKTKIVWIETELSSFFLFFFTQGGCVSCLRACLGARLLPQSYQYPNSKHWFTTSFLHGGMCRKAMLGVWSVPKPFGGRWPRRWTAARR